MLTELVKSYYFFYLYLGLKTEARRTDLNESANILVCSPFGEFRNPCPNDSRHIGCLRSNLPALHTMSLSQYEVQRLENIRANEAALASLGLVSTIGDALAHKPRRTSLGTQRTVKKKARRRSAVTATKVRDMSARARFLSDREERERREAHHRQLQAQRERERQRTLKRARDVRATAH